MSRGARDEARLLALRQRAAAAALVRELAPGVHEFEQTASLVGALSAEGFDIEAAARGDARELSRRLELAVLGHRRAPTLHVVAVLFERLAALAEDAAPPNVAAALSLRRRALEAWRLLSREGTYLKALLSRVARDGEEAVVTAIVQRQLRVVLEAWVSEATAPLLAGHARGAVTLALLRELERDETLADYAKEARESLIDAALAPLRADHGERVAARASSEERVQGLSRWADLWHATGRDGYLALCALQQLVDFGWELRSASKYEQLRQLYAPFRPMLEDLAADVQQRGPAASYASTVGDAFVQLASASRAASDKIAMCERALLACPRHKLAESELAFSLAQRGFEYLESARKIVSPALAKEIETLIARARTLDPEDKRLSQLVEYYRTLTHRQV